MKKKRNKSAEKESILELCYAIHKTANMQKAAELLSDLLTPQEINMIARRMTIAKLLIAGHTFDKIVEEVHVSKQTIARINSWLNESGTGFRDACKAINKLDTSALNFREKKVLTDYDRMVKKYGMYHLPEILAEDLKRLKKKKLESVLKTIKKTKGSNISHEELIQIINES